MTSDQIQKCKNKLLHLLEEHNELEDGHEDSADSVVLDQSGAGTLPGMVSEAIHTHDPEPEFEVSERRKLQGHRIEGALYRIAIGEFGFCRVCKKDIEYSRLEADPTATRCLKCAELS